MEDENEEGVRLGFELTKFDRQQGKGGVAGCRRLLERILIGAD